MMSYALNIPLIHDETTAWPYTRKWSNAFWPLGSNCSIQPNTTYKLKWQAYGKTPTISKGNLIYLGIKIFLS